MNPIRAQILFQTIDSEYCFQTIMNPPDQNLVPIDGHTRQAKPLAGRIVVMPVLSRSDPRHHPAPQPLYILAGQSVVEAHSRVVSPPNTTLQTASVN